MFRKLAMVIVAIGIFGCTSSKLMNTNPESPSVETISSRFEKQGGITDDVKRYLVDDESHKKTLLPAILTTKNEKKVVKKKSPPPLVGTATTASINDGYPADYPQEYKIFDVDSAKIREKISPNFYIGEKLSYRISYIGINMGSIEIETTPNEQIAGRDCAHITGHLKSASFYEFIYKIDDKIDSWIDLNTLVPVKYSLIQRESKQTVDDLQIFDQDSLKTHFLFYQFKKGVEKKINTSVYIPRFFYDVFSAVFFARGAELSIGAVYTFPIVDKARIKIFSMKVLERASVNIMGKSEDAFKIEAKSALPGDLKENGKIYFWVTTAPDRKILQFEANIKLGAVRGELVESVDGVK